MDLFFPTIIEIKQRKYCSLVRDWIIEEEMITGIRLTSINFEQKGKFEATLCIVRNWKNQTQRTEQRWS